MIIDTAGLRRTDSKIEKEGIKKTKEALQKANRVMYIVDDQDGFSNEDQKIIKKFGIENYDLIFNKIDITKKPSKREEGKVEKIYISVKKEDGIKYIKELSFGSFIDILQIQNLFIMAVGIFHILCH